MFQIVESLISKGDIQLSLCGEYMNQTDVDFEQAFQKCLIPDEVYCKDPMAVLTRPYLIVRIGEQLYDWKTARPMIVSMIASKEASKDEIGEETKKQQDKKSWKSWFRRSSKTKAKNSERKNSDSLIEDTAVLRNRVMNSNIDTASKALISDAQMMKGKDRHQSMPSLQTSDIKKTTSQLLTPPKRGVKKSLRPNTDQLKSLKLCIGANTLTYTIHSRLQGTQEVYGHLYYWPQNVKIVISDLDGTITRSDVLGNVMPLMGKDWSQPGVCELYQKIIANGYQIVYITSRAIGQAGTTKSFLVNLKQSNVSLPPGPVFMSPDRLFASFKREVILKKPEVFKLAILRDIKKLFPEDYNPFFAGFGNRETDAIAYRAIDIPLSRIFLINYQGLVIQLDQSQPTSYKKLADEVDSHFPVLIEGEEVKNLGKENQEPQGNGSELKKESQAVIDLLNL